MPKSRILSKRKEIRQIYASGKRVRGSIGQLIACPWPKQQVAFIVGRRVGNAVKRNRLRRHMREFFRTHQMLFPEKTAIILEIFPQEDLPDYHTIESEFTTLCQKL